MCVKYFTDFCVIACFYAFGYDMCNIVQALLLTNGCVYLLSI